MSSHEIRSSRVAAAHRPRVFIINDFGSVTGGADKVAIESSLGLAQRGWDVQYFCAVPPIDPRLSATGVRTFCLGQSTSLDNPNRFTGALQNLWNRAAAAALCDFVSDSLPGATIVHVHGWSKSLSPSCLAAVRNSGHPAVVTLHDYFSVCPNGALFDYTRSENCPLKPMSGACALRPCDKQSRVMKGFRLVRQAIQNSAARFAEWPWHLIAVSDFAYKRIAPFLPATANCRVLFNPINIPRRSPAEPSKSRHFVAIGRFSKEKGLELFAEAARRASVTAVFIGSGEAEARIRSINPDAKILGWLPHQAAMDALYQSRALVFPSLWPETQGLVVLEAAALGIPSIVSDNTAARDRIRHGSNGLIVPANVAALTEAIEQLSNNDVLAAMGLAAYESYWADPLTIDRHLDQLETLYSRLLASV